MGQYEVKQHLQYRDMRRRKERAEIENPFEEIMTKHSPNLVKEKDIQVPETQSPKKDEHKKAHIKRHHALASVAQLGGALSHVSVSLPPHTLSLSLKGMKQCSWVGIYM